MATIEGIWGADGQSVNPNIRMVDRYKDIITIEYMQDLSIDPAMAQSSYYRSKMNIRSRQAIINLSEGSWYVSTGAMQWYAGEVKMTSGVKNPFDLAGKWLSSKVTGESCIKPLYAGKGYVTLEPTYKHLLVVDLDKFAGGVTMEDGMFLACSTEAKLCVTLRRTLSSAVAGNEGLANLSVAGTGHLLMESPVAADELITVNLNGPNDRLAIDGDNALYWTPSLKFTVEKSSRSIVASKVSGEGLVNVYSGVGSVTMSPTS